MSQAPIPSAGPFGGPPEGREASAAVALIRVRGDDPEYLLLRRAANPKDPWSGHFALPGGRRDAGDRDLLATCIRETLEECGVRLTPADLLRPLPMAVAGSHMGIPMGVAPFLFELPAKPALSLDAREIAEAHWLPQSYLRDPCNRLMAAMSSAHPQLSFPCIKVEGSSGSIWGFTFGVLETFWESP
jgi:8-oxo-dGTP pyrophosphatase MutT (NUDIX family)